MAALIVGFCGVARGEVTHFTFPIPGHPNAGQAIQYKVYDLNQKTPKRIAWGISGRFAGIDPMVPLSHHKYGIEIKFIYGDGTFNWFEPTRKFSVKNPGWQHFSGLYMPRLPVKQAVFYYRLATPGEAWYDGVTLFEVPDETVRESCRAKESSGEITLENAYLCCKILPGEGAAVSEFRDRRTGVNYAADDINRRLLLDKLRKGGASYNRQWKAEVKKSDPGEVTVETRLNGVTGYPYLDIVKTLTLKRDSSALEVRYSWLNQPASMAEMVIEPWVVNGLSPRNSPHQGIYYPTAKGVVSAGPLGGEVKHKDVIGGWYAAHGDGAPTMAFQFDWAHYAETWLYLAGDNNVVSDMISQPVKIPAGGEVTRNFAFFPLRGARRPDWVENGIGAEIAETNGTFAVKFDAMEEGTFNVELAVRMAGGGEEIRRGAVFVTPDATATFTTDLAAKGVEWAGVKAYAGGELAFEAERSFAPAHTYRPKREKAKPATVKPFVLNLGRGPETPHAEFAKPYAGGKPRVLSLTCFDQAREVVELLERFDMDVRIVRIKPTERHTSWAMIEQFGTYKYYDMNVSLKRELGTKFDVILVSGNLLDVVDKENREEIHRQISEGAGFIRIGSKLPELKGDEAAWKWIAGNVSPELLPFKAGNLRAAVVGSHREVMFDYEGRLGLTPFIHYSAKFPPFRYQDYSLGVVGRAILWAAKMDVVPPADAQTVEEIVDVEPGFKIRHVFKKGPKGVYDWTAEALHEKKPAEFKEFALEGRGDYKIGENVNGRVKVTRGAARVELKDGFGRLLAVADGVTDAFSLKISEARTGMLFVDAYLMLGGKIVDVRHAKLVCARPWKRAEYPLCISEGWITYAFEKQYLLKPRMEVYRDLGIDLIRFWCSSRPESYMHILPYGFDLDFSIYDARIGSERFGQEYLDPYAKTKDKKYLCRKPCLHDPEYRKSLDARTRANVERIARFCPVTCDCGDENTLTRWTTPFDFCFSEHTLKAFREWLKTQYAGLDALNAAWRTDFATWDAVTPDTTEEARERAKRTGVKSYAAWADHRRFMELTFCETIDRVAKILHEKLPEVPLDMSGTMPPNGWTGMDMWLVSKSVGEPAAYAEGYLGDLVRSFGRPFVKPWTGYGVQPKQVAYLPWNHAFRFLDAGIYFWTCFNFLLPDYSPTPTAVQYGKTGEELRRGAARLLRSLESRHEVLVHYSYGSIHAAQIENRYQGDFLKCNKTWCDALALRSIPYRYVAYAEIEEGELDRTAAKFLILPHSAAISDKEAAAIRRFAARGGTVVGDAETGRMDQHCRLREKPVLRDVIKTTLDLAPCDNDGITIYPLVGRFGAEGRYWGATRSLEAGEGTASRTIRLNSPSFVYDLRAKKALGRVDRFTVELGAGGVGFFAALPYEVGPVKVFVSAAAPGEDVKVSVQAGVPGLSKACHPVIVDVYAPDGKRKRLYSGVCDAKGGRGEHTFRTALNDPKGTWRVVATDYVTGQTGAASFALQNR